MLTGIFRIIKITYYTCKIYFNLYFRVLLGLLIAYPITEIELNTDNDFYLPLSQIEWLAEDYYTSPTNNYLYPRPVEISIGRLKSHNYYRPRKLGILLTANSLNQIPLMKPHYAPSRRVSKLIQDQLSSYRTWVPTDINRFKFSFSKDKKNLLRLYYGSLHRIPVIIRDLAPQNPEVDLKLKLYDIRSEKPSVRTPYCYLSKNPYYSLKYHNFDVFSTDKYKKINRMYSQARPVLGLPLNKPTLSYLTKTQMAYYPLLKKTQTHDQILKNIKNLTNRYWDGSIKNLNYIRTQIDRKRFLYVNKVDYYGDLATITKDKNEYFGRKKPLLNKFKQKLRDITYENYRIRDENRLANVYGYRNLRLSTKMAAHHRALKKKLYNDIAMIPGPVRRFGRTQFPYMFRSHFISKQINFNENRIAYPSTLDWTKVRQKKVRRRNLSHFGPENIESGDLFFNANVSYRRKKYFRRLYETGIIRKENDPIKNVNRRMTRPLKRLLGYSTRYKYNKQNFTKTVYLQNLVYSGNDELKNHIAYNSIHFGELRGCDEWDFAEEDKFFYSRIFNKHSNYAFTEMPFITSIASQNNQIFDSSAGPYRNAIYNTIMYHKYTNQHGFASLSNQGKGFVHDDDDERTKIGSYDQFMMFVTFAFCLTTLTWRIENPSSFDHLFFQTNFSEFFVDPNEQNEAAFVRFSNIVSSLEGEDKGFINDWVYSLSNKGEVITFNQSLYWNMESYGESFFIISGAYDDWMFNPAIQSEANNQVHLDDGNDELELYEEDLTLDDQDLMFSDSEEDLCSEFIDELYSRDKLFAHSERLGLSVRHIDRRFYYLSWNKRWSFHGFTYRNRSMVTRVKRIGKKTHKKDIQFNKWFSLNFLDKVFGNLKKEKKKKNFFLKLNFNFIIPHYYKYLENYKYQLFQKKKIYIDFNKFFEKVILNAQIEHIVERSLFLLYSNIYWRFYIKTFNLNLNKFSINYKILKNNITKFFFYDENYTKALYRYKRSFINENDFYELTFANPFFDPYYEDLLNDSWLFEQDDKYKYIQYLTIYNKNESLTKKPFLTKVAKNFYIKRHRYINFIINKTGINHGLFFPFFLFEKFLDIRETFLDIRLNPDLFSERNLGFNDKVFIKRLISKIRNLKKTKNNEEIKYLLLKSVNQLTLNEENELEKLNYDNYSCSIQRFIEKNPDIKRKPYFTYFREFSLEYFNPYRLNPDYIQPSQEELKRLRAEEPEAKRKARHLAEYICDIIDIEADLHRSWSYKQRSHLLEQEYFKNAHSFWYYNDFKMTRARFFRRGMALANRINLKFSRCLNFLYPFFLSTKMLARTYDTPYIFDSLNRIDPLVTMDILDVTKLFNTGFNPLFGKKLLSNILRKIYTPQDEFSVHHGFISELQLAPHSDDYDLFFLKCEIPDFRLYNYQSTTINFHDLLHLYKNEFTSTSDNTILIHKQSTQSLIDLELKFSTILNSYFKNLKYFIDKNYKYEMEIFWCNYLGYDLDSPYDYPYCDRFLKTKIYMRRRRGRYNDSAQLNIFAENALFYTDFIYPDFEAQEYRELILSERILSEKKKIKEYPLNITLGLYDEVFNESLIDNNELTEKNLLNERDNLKNFFFKLNLKQPETTIETSDYFVNPNETAESKLLFNNIFFDSERKKYIFNTEHLNFEKNFLKWIRHENTFLETEVYTPHLEKKTLLSKWLKLNFLFDKFKFPSIIDTLPENKLHKLTIRKNPNNNIYYENYFFFIFRDNNYFDFNNAIPFYCTSDNDFNYNFTFLTNDHIECLDFWFSNTQYFYQLSSDREYYKNLFKEYLYFNYYKLKEKKIKQNTNIPFENLDIIIDSFGVVKDLKLVLKEYVYDLKDKNLLGPEKKNLSKAELEDEQNKKRYPHFDEDDDDLDLYLPETFYMTNDLDDEDNEINLDDLVLYQLTLNHNLYDIREPYFIPRMLADDEEKIFFLLLKEENIDYEYFMEENVFNEDITTPIYDVTLSKTLINPTEFYKGFIVPITRLNLKPIKARKFFFISGIADEEEPVEDHHGYGMWTTFEPEIFTLYMCVHISLQFTKSYILKETLRLGAFHIKNVTFLAESIQRKLHTKRVRKLYIYNLKHEASVLSSNRWFFFNVIKYLPQVLIEDYHIFTIKKKNIFFSLEKELLRMKFFDQFLLLFFYKPLNFLVEIKEKQKSNIWAYIYRIQHQFDYYDNMYYKSIPELLRMYKMRYYTFYDNMLGTQMLTWFSMFFKNFTGPRLYTIIEDEEDFDNLIDPVELTEEEDSFFFVRYPKGTAIFDKTKKRSTLLDFSDFNFFSTPGDDFNMFYSNFDFQREHNNKNRTIERIKLRYEDQYDFLLKLGYGWRADKNVDEKITDEEDEEDSEAV